MLATIENDFLKLSVKGSGAEMVSVKSIRDNVEYLWQGDPEFWPRRAPILFPIVGKLNDHKLRIDGKEFLLPQHGFARNLMFDLVAGTESNLVFLLKSNDETFKQFPYKFELLIGYKLVNKRVEVTYEVKNVDQQTIWFSIGAHPGFAVMANPGEKFEDYFLEFSKEENAERYLLKDGLFNGEKEMILNNSKVIDLNFGLFEKDAIVFKNLKSESVSLKSKKSPYHIHFNFKGFPYLGIWTPRNNAPFLCIEPWFGLADKVDFAGSFSEKEGVQSLSPGAVFKANYWFEVVSA